MQNPEKCCFPLLNTSLFLLTESVSPRRSEHFSGEVFARTLLETLCGISFFKAPAPHHGLALAPCRESARARAARVQAGCRVEAAGAGAADRPRSGDGASLAEAVRGLGGVVVPPAGRAGVSARSAAPVHPSPAGVKRHGAGPTADMMNGRSVEPTLPG